MENVFKKGLLKVSLSLLGLSLVFIITCLITGQLNPSAAHNRGNLNVLYLPTINLGQDYKATISLSNIEDKTTGVTITAYETSGNCLSVITSITKLEAGETKTIDQPALPSGTSSLKIESSGNIDANVLFETLDGRKSELIAAVKDLSNELYFPIFGAEDTFHKTIILMNPNSNFASIEIVALNEDGFGIDRKILPSLSSMENISVSLLSFFDYKILENISTIGIISDKNIIGLQFSDSFSSDFVRLPAITNVGVNKSDILPTNVKKESFEAEVKTIEKLEKSISTFEIPEDVGIQKYKALSTISITSVPEASSGFGWPLPYSFSNNGGYTFKQLALYSGGYVYHPGEDWNVPNSPGGYCDGDKGLSVLAVANGQVVYVNSSSWGGLVIQHNYKGQTWYSQYGHVQNIIVNAGAVVTKGQKVAEIGKVGLKINECAHLHFEIREADHPNPSYGPYWVYGSSGLYNLNNVENWYEDPDLFIPSHPAYTTATPTLRIDGGTSSTKSQGSTFYLTGSYYTPNGTVSRYLTRPGESEVAISSITANSSGNISWSFTSTCSDKTGTYYIRAKDNATGKYSNTVSEIITFNYSCDKTIPNVTALSVSPTSNPVGKSFTISYSVKDSGGSGLKQVELWRQPNGGSWSQIKTTTLSGQTSYSGTFSDAPSSAGTYWYGLHVVDRAGNWNDEKNSRTGYSPGQYGPDKVVVYNPPTLRIDGSTSSTRSQGGTFSLTGSYYTVNGAVTRYLKDPNGTTQTLSTIYANSSGNIGWSFTSSCSTQPGTYYLWAKDNTTGRTSNTITEVVTRNSSCSPRLYINGGTSSTKSQGGTFVTTGFNYTPGGAVTRYLKQPNGSTITLSPTLYANSSSYISWSFTSSCSNAPGTYYLWVKDNGTGRYSNTVTEIITHSSSCP